MALYAGHFDFLQPLLKTVPNLLSLTECNDIIEQVQNTQWLGATINSTHGRMIDEKLRNNTTAIVRDQDLVHTVYSRILPNIPPLMIVEDHTTGQRVHHFPTGLFLPMRVYRYEVGQHFGLHQDQSYTVANGDRSLLTLLVYLNEDFEGGETEFPEQNQVITPKTGSALWFQHMLLHAGNRIHKGTKYVLRSDVLYRKQTE